MQYNITRAPSYSLASICRKNDRMAVLRMSVDIHTKNDAATEAIASVYTEALVSGCKEYDRTAFQEAISLLGAHIDVSFSEGQLHITAESIAANMPKLLSLVSCMLVSPTFHAREFRRIRSLCINELREHKEDAKSIAAERLANALYATSDRRYSFDPDTLIDRIPAVTTKDLRAMHQRIHEAYWYCTVGGSNQTIRAAERFVTTTKSRCVEHAPGIHTPRTPKSHVLLTDIPSKQNIEFSIGGALPITLHHPDYHAFLFGLNVLGKWGGFAGRLMSTVREKEGLTYGIYARIEGLTGTEQGFWRVMTFFAPQHAAQGLRSTLREIKKIASSGITEHEHSRFKTILHTQQALLKDSLKRALSELHAYHTAGFTLHEMREHKERMLQVTRKEVNAALRRYLDPEQVVISGAGPIDDVKKTLSKFG